MTSIIIRIGKNIDYIQLCLDSIFQNTSQVKTPFEVIVFGKPEKEVVGYLEGLLKDGKIILSKSDDINEVSKTAKGEYLCFLDGDVIVPEGWLQRLQCCLKSDSMMAAVGPWSNLVEENQRSPYSFEFRDMEGFNKFSTKFSHLDKKTDHLSMFCFLVKKTVWEETGGLDKDLGILDFSLRFFCFEAVKKGYRFQVCSNVYVHKFIEHKYKQIDIAISQRNFMAKTGCYKKITLAMIVADSEKKETLERCLNSVAGYVDEIILLFNYKNYKRPFFSSFMSNFKRKYTFDYGRFCKVKTDNIKWTNFSDMRNKSFDMATGDYVLWLDADDVMISAPGLREVIFYNPDADYFQFQVHSLKENGRKELIIHNRLLRNDKRYRFRNSCHEDISYSLMEAGANRVKTGLIIKHLGNINKKDWKRKNERNIKFLEKDMASPNAHALTYFGMINALMLTEKPENYLRAIKLIKEALEKFKLDEKDPLLAKLWVLFGGANLLVSRSKKLKHMNQAALAGAKHAFKKAWDEWRHPEAAINYADILMRSCEWQKALEVLDNLYDMKDFVLANIPFDIDEVQINLLSMLGDCWFQEAQKDRTSESQTIHKEGEVTPIQWAEKYYRECLNVNPRNLVIIDRLCQILRNTNRVDDAAFITIKAINAFPRYFPGWANMGAYEIMNKRYQTARVFFEKALKINPRHQESLHNLRAVKMVLAGRHHA
jgi:tetratricopeptide (TPR) repeat protein